MTIRVEKASEYGMGNGFVIEQLRYWNFCDRETWAIPAWEEMGCADLSGVFPSEVAAERAIRDHA